MFLGGSKLTLSPAGLRKVWLCLHSEAEGGATRSRPPAQNPLPLLLRPGLIASNFLAWGGGPVCTESDGTSLQRDCTRLHKTAQPLRSLSRAAACCARATSRRRAGRAKATIEERLRLKRLAGAFPSSSSSAAAASPSCRDRIRCASRSSLPALSHWP